MEIETEIKWVGRSGARVRVTVRPSREGQVNTGAEGGSRSSRGEGHGFCGKER